MRPTGVLFCAAVSVTESLSRILGTATSGMNDTSRQKHAKMASCIASPSCCCRCFDAAIAPTLFSNASDAEGNTLYDVVSCALTPGPVASTTGFDLLPAAGPEALET